MNRIKISKPYRRWLFGGLGFHNSEATMTPMMSDKFLNERVLKCFHEISPTFTRVYGGFADWTREAMDSFADYYDRTFRKVGTLVYMVPGRMPMPSKDFDLEDYCERTATNLEYLVKKRQCTKIRYFCATNELSVGNTYAYLADKLDYFAEIHAELNRAFLRHGLDIGLLATDASGASTAPQIKWATENMDEITSDYCLHLYMNKYQPGEPEAYGFCKELFGDLAAQARAKQKRFIVGEFGIVKRNRTLDTKDVAMANDVCYAVEYPENEGIYAVALAEMGLSILNSGSFSGVHWTMFDYPDPFIKEDGDTLTEKARYDVACFSGHGLQIRYNKHGLVRWCDDEKDYSSRASLYTMGYLAKLFKKGSRVLECEWDNDLLRAGAVTNADGSVSICIVSWSEKEEDIEFELEHKTDKPLRRYDFSADNIPYNDFCDLQGCSELVECNGGAKITVGARSVTFLTTDYIDREPSKIKGVKLKNGILSWKPCIDEEHCYYRVYASSTKDFTPSYENQIASTVAEEHTVDDCKLYYKVVSVDKYGNVGK